MSNAKEVISFMARVGPPLFELAGELFHLFDGNADLALQEIQDRRADIARRRARTDEALRNKHSSND